jgi:SAM-dependent methyltransferase/uncharacterized protein YbaR (Trm112 family)
MASPLEHAHILRCPVSHERLSPLAEDALARVNRLIAQGDPSRDDASGAEIPWQAGLVNEAGTLAYQVRDDIAYLLAELAVALPSSTTVDVRDHPGRRQKSGEQIASDHKNAVRRFYDETGWKVEGDDYGDARLFIDRRPAVQSYQKRCAERIEAVLKQGGRYLLDAASGPVPRGTETGYAQGFEFHVCLDISIQALHEAGRNLGEKGIYILGDITSLPVMNAVMDGVASLHTIYHVPREQQRDAFLEIHRVLRPGGVAAIAYNWGRHAIAVNLLTFPIQVFRFLQKRLAPLRTKRTRDVDKLYFHAHSHAWFTNQEWPFAYSIIPLQTVNKAFFTLYVHEPLGGDWLLRRLSSIEDKYKHALSDKCYYPLIVIDGG